MGGGLGAAEHLHHERPRRRASCGWCRWRASPSPCRASTTSSTSSCSGSTPTSCARARPPVPGRSGTTPSTASRRRPTTAPSGFSPVSLLVGLVTLGAVVVALHLAAPGRLGRPGARHPVPPLPGLGRRRRGSCRSSTCGCPTPPSATAFPPDDPHRPAGAALVDRLARARPSGAARPASAALFSTGTALVRVHPGRAGLPGRHRLGARASSARSPPPTGSSWRARHWEAGRSGADRARRSTRTSAPNPILSKVFTSEIALLLPGVHLAWLRSR